ncbi:MAG: class I SAM-dependent methyltransferase [Bacillota bacterium]|nr:class I SAM-dependent methyltransferase [Bacillota bacterium]
MELSNRLQVIAGCITKGNSVADIGTDHAYLPIYLIDNNISRNIFASDIVEGPVRNALSNVKKHNMDKEIKIIQASGLKGITDFIDTIIISGMGGMQIIDILSDDLDIAYAAKELILQPMKNSIELRKFLVKNKFNIVEEKIAIDNEKYYEIIKAVKGNMIVNDSMEYEVTPALRRNRDKSTRLFIEKKIDTTRKIIKKLENESSKNKKLVVLERKLKYLMEVYDSENQFKESD